MSRPFHIILGQCVENIHVLAIGHRKHIAAKERVLATLIGRVLFELNTSKDELAHSHLRMMEALLPIVNIDGAPCGRFGQTLRLHAEFSDGFK